MVMPMTGVTIRLLHGGKPRRPRYRKVDEFDRLIIATDSLNAFKWLAFYGKNTLVNNLLNMPLLRNGHGTSPKSLRCVLGLLITVQWTLVLASCATQGWDAFTVSIWIGICAVMSSHIYPPGLATYDWLQYHCQISVLRIHANFSSRRAMLSALVTVNPDTSEGRTSWIDPILEKTPPDRHVWESSLLLYIKQNRR
jgi:hypothetical protein